MKQVKAHHPSQTFLTVLVVLLDIQSAAFSKTIIDTEIYDNAFTYFFERVLEVRKKISQKQAPYICDREKTATNWTNQEHHQDDAAQDFESYDDVIV